MSKFILHTDGGARGNPGPAGAGVAILDQDKQVLKTVGKFLGENLTNNEAEYLALIFGLENLKKLAGGTDEIIVKLDSELVVKQLRGEYKVKEARLRELFNRVQETSAGFTHLTYLHIPREENKLADKLANEAMDAR